MELYDMHSHILPDFDDGAKTVEESLKLINELRKQGVRNICLTPHFYTNEMSYEDYLEDRERAYEAFLPYVPEDINVVLGCEVYITDYIFNNSDLSKITYGKSRYILTEFSYNTPFTEKTIQRFYMLTQNYGLCPVIPHVERYSYLMEHPDVIAQLKDIGVVIQTNVTCYTKEAPFFKKHKLLKLIKHGLIDILGTDTHSMNHNPPTEFREAMSTISQKCGSREVKRMMMTAERMFKKASGVTRSRDLYL